MGVMVDLYHNRVLELAADIPHVGALADAHGSATKVSRICGSTVRVDVKLEDDGDPDRLLDGECPGTYRGTHGVGHVVGTHTPGHEETEAAGEYEQQLPVGGYDFHRG